jgi:hypothetical protein
MPRAASRRHPSKNTVVLMLLAFTTLVPVPDIVDQSAAQDFDRRQHEPL